MQAFAQLSITGTGQPVQCVARREPDLVEEAPELLVQLPIDESRSKPSSQIPRSDAGVGDKKFTGGKVCTGSGHRDSLRSGGLRRSRHAQHR
ncbi:hypothetical protein B1H26_24655 [Amycolatopsis sp. BJA-103]|nr:hypothetical protein BKN51_21015 [Amycolatopsis sp. BJA-103]PNE16452.1 hypothetical protein B1H26_24655 [Amycolatopsis sp. BJA-103]